METTYAFLKQNGLLAAALPVLLYLQFSTGAEIRDLRAEMAEGHQEIRAEMVKGDQAIRAEMNAGFQSIRAEMAAGDQSIRAEMAKGDQSIRAELADTNERLARVETRLTSIERVIYADLNPPAP